MLKVGLVGDALARHVGSVEQAGSGSSSMVGHVEAKAAEALVEVLGSALRDKRKIIRS